MFLYLNEMRHLMFVIMHRYVDGDFKFVKPFTIDLVNLHSHHFIKWRQSKRIACIFKTIFGGTSRRTTLSNYIICIFGVAFSNISLFDLDRHSHAPFFMMVKK